MVKNKAAEVALGVSRDGIREVLGLWIADNEGAKFWLPVMNELKNRGVQDVLIAVVPSHGLRANHCRVTDGVKGFPEAITAAFPDAMVQPGLRPFRAELVHWTNSKTPLTLHRASLGRKCIAKGNVTRGCCVML